MAFDGLVSIVKDEDLSSFSTQPLYSLGAKHFKSGNEYVYVYKGDGTTARRTGGAKPTTNVTVANGVAGHTDAGVHIFGYVY